MKRTQKNLAILVFKRDEEKQNDEEFNDAQLADALLKCRM